jgi:hypothetical protein
MNFLRRGQRVLALASSSWSAAVSTSASSHASKLESFISGKYDPLSKKREQRDQEQRRDRDVPNEQERRAQPGEQARRKALGVTVGCKGKMHFGRLC